jgi:hypothetical protein
MRLWASSRSMCSFTDIRVIVACGNTHVGQTAKLSLNSQLDEVGYILARSGFCALQARMAQHMTYSLHFVFTWLPRLFKLHILSAQHSGIVSAKPEYNPHLPLPLPEDGVRQGKVPGTAI